MALAHLSFVGPTEGGYEFLADVGSNAFFEVRLGEPSAGTRGRALESVDAVSDLVRAPRPGLGFDNAFGFVIPAELFRRSTTAVVLASFRTADRRGEAESAAVSVPSAPAALLAGGHPQSMSRSTHRVREPARAKPIRFREVRAATARSMAAGASDLASDFAVELERDVMVRVGPAQRAVYSAEQDVVLLARLRARNGAPRPSVIPRAIAEVVFEGPRGDAWLTTQTRIEGLDASAPIRLTLGRDALRGVPRGEDILARIRIRWPSASGVAMAEGAEPLVLMGPLLATSLGEPVGERLAVSDPVRFREFWHKIWDGPSSGPGRWKLDVECRYYVRTATRSDVNQRLETVMLTPADARDPGASGLSGRWKTGMELSLDSLDRLLPSWAHERSLAPVELDALRAGWLRRATDVQATAHLQARGKQGESAVVWAFPELRRRTIVLEAASRISPEGRVVQTSAKVARFPFPTSMRFITLRSS